MVASVLAVMRGTESTANLRKRGCPESRSISTGSEDECIMQKRNREENRENETENGWCSNAPAAFHS